MSKHSREHAPHLPSMLLKRKRDNGREGKVKRDGVWQRLLSNYTQKFSTYCCWKGKREKANYSKTLDAGRMEFPPGYSCVQASLTTPHQSDSR